MMRERKARERRRTSEVFPVNGMEMHVDFVGQGDPLLLLHGWPASGRMWEPFVATLSRRYRLIIPDLRGHGRSTNPQHDFSHRMAATDVLELIERLGIDQVKAVGASSGALVLLHMATQKPQQVASMVLVGSSPYIPAASRQVVGRWISERNWDHLRDRHGYSDAQMLDVVPGLRFYVGDVEDVSFTPPRLAKITARTLLVQGDRDEHFPVDLVVQMYQAISHSFLWIVPNGSHLPIFGLHEHAFVETVERFLTGDWNGAAAS